MLPFEYNRVVLTKPANPVSPIYRSTSFCLKDKGERPIISKDDVLRTTSELNINRLNKSTNNIFKQTNQDLNPFAPPQEAKEINVAMNSETKFDNYINASYLNSCEQLKLFIAA